VSDDPFAHDVDPGAETAFYDKAARTAYASRAVVLAELFAHRFKKIRLEGDVVRKVEIREADMETTGGGSQARMPIVLVPERGKNPTLVAGWLDVATEEAEVRIYGVLASLSLKRYGRKLDMKKGSYNALLQQIQEYCDDEGVKLRQVSEIKEADGPSPLASRSRPPANTSRPAKKGTARPAVVEPLEVGFGVFLLGIFCALVVGVVLGFVLFSPSGMGINPLQ
jgi:hypothetical protein